jgi:HSP20 family protein
VSRDGRLDESKEDIMLVRRVWPTRPTFDTSFRDFDLLRREMLRTFEALAGDRAPAPAAAGVFPPINVTQDADRFYVRAEIPGIKANDLEISVLRNRLTISGKREIAKEHERASYHRRERAEGEFSRTLTLPTPVEADRVEARYAEGILTLTLPKAEEAKPRQIVVKT